MVKQGGENMKKLLSEIGDYCRWRTGQGLCEEYDCLYCCVNEAYDKIRDDAPFEYVDDLIAQTEQDKNNCDAPGSEINEYLSIRNGEIKLTWSEFWNICRRGQIIDTENEVKNYLSDCDEIAGYRIGDEIPKEIINEIAEEVIKYRISRETTDDIYYIASEIYKKKSAIG